MQRCDNCNLMFAEDDLHRIDVLGAGDYCNDCSWTLLADHEKTRKYPRECPRCKEAKMVLYFGHEAYNDYICFNCYIDLINHVPHPDQGTTFTIDGTPLFNKPLMVDVCEECGTMLDVTWYNEGIFCRDCYNKKLTESEKNVNNVCSVCGGGSSEWKWVLLGETYDFVCLDCDARLSKINATILPSAASALLALPDTASTTATNVVTPIKSSPRCRDCWATVSYEGQLCEKCRKFEESMNRLDEGAGFVFETIEIDMLRQYCTADEEWFWTLPNAQHINGDKATNFTYFNNGADILFVGHLDKASGSMPRQVFKYGVIPDKEQAGVHHPVVYNGNLDDRLGVFMGHYLLPTKYGIEFDVLLTTNEETGGTTAEDFMTWWDEAGRAINKPEGFQYRWIIEFDRRGTTTVMYQYETKEWKEIVAKYVEFSTGSFSDIGRLEGLGCKAFNWGTGYIDEHSKQHRAYLENTLYMVEKFVDFYWDYKDTFMPHTPSKSVTRSYGGYRTHGYGWDEDYENDPNYWVNYREISTTSTHTTKKCENCGEDTSTWYNVHNPFLDKRQDLCLSCRNLLLVEARLSGGVSGQPALVCDQCDSVVKFIYKVDDRDLCHDCAQKPFKKHEELWKEVVTEADPKPFSGCTFCGKRSDNYYEADGFKVCQTCLNEGALYG